MIFGKWNPEKIWHENLTDCPPRLSDIATVPCEIQKSHSVLFIHTSDYLRYLTRKQSVIHLPTQSENVTTLTCELQNFFIWLKVCCVLWDVGGSEKSKLWVVIGGSENNRLWCVATGMSGKKCHSKCSDWPRSALISGAVRYPRHLDTYTVDTDVTIPVSPRSRYSPIAVYRRTNNYRETTQLHASIVSITDAVQRFRL